MRMLPFNIVVGCLVLVLLYALYCTERGWLLHDRPVVAHLGEISQPSDFDLAQTLDDYGVHQLRLGTNVQRFTGIRDPRLSDALLGAPITVPAAGRSIHEFGFFGMPFGWTTDLGDVVYLRDHHEYVFTQLNRRGTAALNAANGGDPFIGRIFPFWTHAWGWAWVAGLALAIWLWFREQASRRADAGMI